MRVVVNRDLCSKQLAFCESCLGKFLRKPMGYERLCFELIEDDGSDILTIDMHSGGHDVTLRLNENQRLLLADEGWANFVSFAVPMYREEPQRT